MGGLIKTGGSIYYLQSSNNTNNTKMKRLQACNIFGTEIKRRRILPPVAVVDRLTSLPDEVLGRILSMLQTKDVAATQVLSKKMEHVFSLITSVDLDDYHKCHCEERDQPVDRFPLFKSFVVKVLQKLSEVGEGLTRFRIRVGGDKRTHDRKLLYPDTLSCLPYMEHAFLNAWVLYPLAHNGLKELDLTFHIRNPNEYKLPPQLFDSRSLESCRFDANIWIDGADIPLICFPNLKLLHISSVVFTEDDFITRLVSSCPALEELSLMCEWEKLDRVAISSHSLRRLSLCVPKRDDNQNYRITDLVLIDTPNLQYFFIAGNIPNQYSVSHMNAIVEAELNIWNMENGFQIQLFDLLSALSNVQHLYLEGQCLEVICLASESKDQLPVFHNLRTIKLGPVFEKPCWDMVLPSILHYLPLLETLVFPYGLYGYTDPRSEKDWRREGERWRTNQCFPIHLKRIEFGWCKGDNQELNFIKYVLSKASTLKELVICLSSEFRDFDKFVSKLEKLPRASNSCSILVEQ